MKKGKDEIYFRNNSSIICIVRMFKHSRKSKNVFSERNVKSQKMAQQSQATFGFMTKLRA